MSKMTKAVAVAVLAMSASAANAGITIPAGDWTIDIGGNVNAYYTNTRYSGALKSNLNLAPTNQSANNISTGLLPSAIGFGGKTRQNDLDIAFQFTFFTGTNAKASGSDSFTGNNGADVGSINMRQSFLTFGDKSWGTIKAGRDLGVFGSDAILSDMTLLGVGQGAGGSGNSTLGRIGAGYLYADWVGQIQYASPNWNGFSFAVAAREPWGNAGNHELGYDAKVSYEWAGDINGKVWLGGIHQKTSTAATVVGAAGHEGTAEAWEIGAKANMGAFGLVGYYYDGQNMGALTGPGMLAGTSWPTTGLGIQDQAADRDVNGGYVQATFTAPFGTKFGLSWGESDVDAQAGTVGSTFKDESWIVGAYHPLTKSLNLVAEYTDTKLDNIGNVAATNGKAKTIALGAILFF